MKNRLQPRKLGKFAIFWQNKNCGLHNCNSLKMWYHYLIVDKCLLNETEILQTTVLSIYAKVSAEFKKKE